VNDWQSFLICQVNEIQQKKRALVAESDICRQALKLEIQSLRQYTLLVQKKADPVRVSDPILMATGLLFSSEVTGRRSREKRHRRLWSRALGAGLMAGRLLLHFRPQRRAALLRQ
jgi:hypothetical protein